jgi:hypothetical protein
VERTVVAPKDISAIQIEQTDDGKARLGMLAPIPEGAELEVCGTGFNNRTVKARWRDRFYFVFLQDIQGPDFKRSMV